MDNARHETRPEKHRHEGPVLYSASGYDLINCRRCGFKHIVPLPSPDELDAIYREQYYTKEKPRYIEHYREDIEWWNLVYDGWLDTLEELVPRHRRRLLDIGCGPGLFLKRAGERGWETLGIEPSSRAAAHARSLGLNVLEESFSDDLASTLADFGAVAMTEVLEHVPDPEAMLRAARSVLASGGVLFVLVPNDDNPFQKAAMEALGKTPWWFAPPHHINYFNRNSLARLVERCGYQVEVCEGTFPIDIFLLMGDDYIGNDTKGRRCHGKRMLFETHLARAGMGELRQNIYRALIDLDIGREVAVFARRTDGEEALPAPPNE